VIYKASNASITRTARVNLSKLRFTGNKLKRTSRLSCGANGTYTGVDSCSGYSLYRTYHDGICGTYTTLYESNSATCGYVAPPPPPPPVPPPPPPPVGCTPGLECVNDACAYCNPGSGDSCVPAGISCCSTWGYLNSDCSRNVQCGNCCPGGYFTGRPGC